MLSSWILLIVEPFRPSKSPFCSESNLEADAALFETHGGDDAALFETNGGEDATLFKTNGGEDAALFWKVVMRGGDAGGDGEGVGEGDEGGAGVGDGGGDAMEQENT